MRILFYNPAPTQRRFVPFEAIKGSAFFRKPNYDAMRLSFLSKNHEFAYYDEWIEEKPEFKPDILVVHIPLYLARYVQSTIKKKWCKAKIVCFGLYSTLFPKLNKRFANTVVIGDIASVWTKILSDFQNNELKDSYRSNNLVNFYVNREIETKYGFTPILSQLKTSFGCRCLSAHRDYCYENILYKNNARWDSKKVVDEITHIKRKIIHIIDDDFLYDIDYAIRILEKCWRYKKMWIFQTSSRLFDHRHLMPILRDDGVRIIYLKEDWLGMDLVNKIEDRTFFKEKEHQISMIHNYRIAVGSKLRLGFEGENYKFYRKLLKFLINTKVDLIEVAVRTPIPRTRIYEEYDKNDKIIKDLSLYDQWMPVLKLPGVSPQALYTWMEWLRDRFYSWDSILLRNIIVSPRLGFYNTIFFYLIPNLSYRNNFLEKVGYPP
jgi:radical SAM superfamily enzyme YgiQ (UPF0313 family)